MGLLQAPLVSYGQPFYKVEGHWGVNMLKPLKIYCVNSKYKQEVALPFMV
jgi:hypothetical protein